MSPPTRAASPWVSQGEDPVSLTHPRGPSSLSDVRFTLYLYGPMGINPLLSVRSDTRGSPLRYKRARSVRCL